MFRSILMLVLAVISNSAMAEWTKVIANGNVAIFYVDLSAKRESGSIVQMWDLTDFNTNQKVANGSFLSRIIEGEYNCKEKQERVVFVTRYRGHMGNGAAVDSGAYPNAKWEAVSAGTIGEALWKAACKK
jgi:phage tail protein X